MPKRFIAKNMAACRPTHWAGDMACGFLTFGDIDGKLNVLRVECTRCERKGRYSVAKLIEKYERNGNMMKCARC
jgi:hypothetical protein